MCSCARRGSTNSVRREAKFASPIKAITPVQSRREKYFYFSFSEIMISLRHPASMRGALRDRHERWVRDAVGASTLQRDLTRTNSVDARGQVVWSRHPGADACATRRVSVVAWGQESRSPGRARSSRSNHRAGKAGRFRLHLWFCRVRFCCTRTMGASRRPVFPAPSISKRVSDSASPGRNRTAGTRRCVFQDRHCEERSDEAIQTADAGMVWIASLSLAMTSRRRVKGCRLAATLLARLRGMATSARRSRRGPPFVGRLEKGELLRC